MAALPQNTSLPLLSAFNNSDEEDGLTKTTGGIALFTMETTNNNLNFGDQSMLSTGETAEHIPGTRKRSDSSASDSSDGSEKTVVPSSRIGNCGVLSTFSDSVVALLSTSIPASEEVAHAESGTKKRISSVSSHSSNASSVASDRTVMPNPINSNGGISRSGYTVEAYDATPEYHLPTEIEYPVHEAQDGYLDDTNHFRPSSGEHRFEYPVDQGQNGYLGHSRSSSRASNFEAGLQSLSLSNGARDAKDTLKCKSHHTITNTLNLTLTDYIS
jgi:hypothetical protein